MAHLLRRWLGWMPGGRIPPYSPEEMGRSEPSRDHVFTSSPRFPNPTANSQVPWLRLLQHSDGELSESAEASGSPSSLPVYELDEPPVAEAEEAELSELSEDAGYPIWAHKRFEGGIYTASSIAGSTRFWNLRFNDPEEILVFRINDRYGICLVFLLYPMFFTVFVPVPPRSIPKSAATPTYVGRRTGDAAQDLWRPG